MVVPWVFLHVHHQKCALFLSSLQCYIVCLFPNFEYITSIDQHLFFIYAPLRRREGILLCCCLSVCSQQFPFIFFAEDAHIEMKFSIQVDHDNIQVKFDFGYGQAIFIRVMPLGCRKLSIICCFRLFSSQRMHNWNGIW